MARDIRVTLLLNQIEQGALNSYCAKHKIQHSKLVREVLAKFLSLPPDERERLAASITLIAALQDDDSLSCGDDVQLGFGFGEHFGESSFERPSAGLPRLITRTPLTSFQRSALTRFIYSAAQRGLSPELLSDTKPPSDQDLLILALLSAARAEMSDSDTAELFCGLLEISYLDFLEATEFFRSRWSIVAHGNN
jgi:hypothetical protein